MTNEAVKSNGGKDGLRVSYWFCCAAIVVLAVFLRAPAMRSGLPYIDYIDEGYVLHQAIDLLNHRSLDTRWYGYPSLPAYLTTVTLIAYSPIYHFRHGHGFRQDLPDDRSIHTSSGDNYDLISPPELIVAGRFVTVCLSLGTVVLAGAIATSLAGQRAGLLAMMITAVCPALVTRASNVIVDTFATFFALLALYFCDRLQRAGQKNHYSSRWSAVFAGLAAGLAFASKYTVAVVFAAVALTIITLPTNRSFRAWLVVLACGGFLLSSALAAPETLIKPKAVAREVAITAHNYTIITSSPGYFGQAVARSELGWPLVIVGCSGLLLMLGSGTTRVSSLSWILFGGLLLVLFVGRSFQPFRNLLPLVPEFCIAAAVALVQLLRLPNRDRDHRLGYLGSWLLVLAIVGGLGYSSWQALRARILHRDTRVLAMDWLRTHTTKNSRILVLSELGFLPGEWQRIDASVRISPWLNALDLLRREKFDYVVSGNFDFRTGAGTIAASYQKIWAPVVSSFIPCASFGHVPTPSVPYFWRTNDERILIYAIQGRPTGLEKMLQFCACSLAFESRMLWSR